MPWWVNVCHHGFAAVPSTQVIQTGSQFAFGHGMVLNIFGYGSFMYLLLTVACMPGKYRSTLNSSCVDCPANSNSLLAAAECSCNAGYYRVSGSEGIGVGCTG